MLAVAVESWRIRDSSSSRLLSSSSSPGNFSFRRACPFRMVGWVLKEVPSPLSSLRTGLPYSSMDLPGKGVVRGIFRALVTQGKGKKSSSGERFEEGEERYNRWDKIHSGKCRHPNSTCNGCREKSHLESVYESKDKEDNETSNPRNKISNSRNEIVCAIRECTEERSRQYRLYVWQNFTQAPNKGVCGAKQAALRQEPGRQ